jgi:hypothetical protein
MFDHSELTVVKNSAGMPTALGYPINSALLQNNNPLFVGGGGKSSMAVPAGLVCMTTTTCTNANANEMGMSMGANEMGMSMGANEMGANTNEIIGYAEDDREIVPDGLYERLLELAENKPMKRMTKRKLPHAKKGKSKTHKKK